MNTCVAPAQALAAISLAQEFSLLSAFVGFVEAADLCKVAYVRLVPVEAPSADPGDVEMTENPVYKH